MKQFAGVFGVMLAAWGAPVAAQSDAAAERVLKSFAECRAIADAAARLPCFDRAAAALEAAVAAKDVRIVNRADVRKANKSLFGFTLPKIDLFGGDRDDDADAFTEINSTVAFTRTVENNRVQIGLADESGAVWQTTDPMSWPPKRGAKIRIRKGSLGNYFLSIDGKNVRGMRLR